MAAMEKQLQKLSNGEQQNTDAYKRLKLQYDETAKAMLCVTVRPLQQQEKQLKFTMDCYLYL